MQTGLLEPVINHGEVSPIVFFSTSTKRSLFTEDGCQLGDICNLCIMKFSPKKWKMRFKFIQIGVHGADGALAIALCRGSYDGGSGSVLIVIGVVVIV